MSAGDGPRRPYDTLRRIVGPLAAPVYAAAVAARNRRFDRGVGVRRAPVPVVSVGNLTVGETGKTPFVIWLCRRLLERGISPAIAMRGYKAEANAGRSDEAEEYRAALSGVPVIVNPDRSAAIDAFLVNGTRPDVFVLDDGFQHRRLHRELDIVLVDVRAGTARDHLLPRGDLREPLSGLSRAGVVVLTHADDAAATEEAVHGLRRFMSAGAVLARATHRWSDIAVDDAGNKLTWRTEALKNKRVIAVCGIARPEGFLAMLAEAGCDVAAAFTLRDHQPIDAALTAQVAQQAAAHRAQIIVTTQKDFARMGVVPQPWRTLTVVRPRLALQVDPASAVIDRVTGAVAAGRPPG